MVMVSGPRVVGVLENGNNLVFSRPLGAETSLVVREEIVDFKVVLDTAGS
jgi:hypothetical protein